VSTYHFTAVIEKDADGYFAFCPELQGCYTQGDTHQEALANVEVVIQEWMETAKELGCPIPGTEEPRGCAKIVAVRAAARSAVSPVDSSTSTATYIPGNMLSIGGISPSGLSSIRRITVSKTSWKASVRSLPS